MSLTESIAPREPVTVGVKITLMVQSEPAASESPQVLVWLESPLSAPVMEMSVIARELPPDLLRVTARVALELETTALPNSTLPGLRATTGPDAGNPRPSLRRGPRGAGAR